MTDTPESLRDVLRVNLRDEISGFPIGSGYYQSKVGVDEAREIVEELLPVIDEHYRRLREAEKAAEGRAYYESAIAAFEEAKARRAKADTEAAKPVTPVEEAGQRLRESAEKIRAERAAEAETAEDEDGDPGLELDVPPAPPRQAQTVDLVAALRASVEAATARRIEAGR